MSGNLENSRLEFERARQLIPGGVNSPARAFGAVGGTPPFIQCGQGPYLEDLDGNRYLDYVGSWGPLILGHRHPAVLDAIEQALSQGTSFGAPCPAETELAEMVVEAVRSVEMVRMVNSGTEAAMSVIRLARGATGRDEIIKFAGCYHGHADSLLVAAGSGALTHGAPTSPGVPADVVNATHVLEYNDPAGLEELFAQRGDDIALVILEAVCGNMGVVVPTPEFLATARRLCDRHGALLCLDEVMTGFRLAYGGAQSLFNIRPDLTMFGKIIGGGMPVGAYGGRKDLMEQVSPIGKIYQAGTLSGNPLAMACGIATLKTLQQEDPYPRLARQTEELTTAIAQAGREAGLPISVGQFGSMFTLFFTEGPVTNFTTASQSRTELFAQYFHAMLSRGIYLPCSQFEANFVSAVHTQADLDATVQAAREAFAELT